MLSAQPREPLAEVRRIEQVINKADLPSALDARRPGFLGTMDKPNGRNDENQDFGSGSDYSDMSALENETDDFGRKLFQRYREQQRLDEGAQGRPQAFRKARPGPRLSERLGRAPPTTGNAVSASHERTGSHGSTGSDPPLNVPRDWGSKGRTGASWMRNIRAPVDGGAAQPSHQASVFDEERSRRPTHSAPKSPYDDDHLAAVDQTPPSMRRRQMETSVSSMHHMNTTLQEAMDAEDQDFTGFSLLASTPVVNNRNRKVDELMRRGTDFSERRVAMRSRKRTTEPPAPEVRPQTTPLPDQNPPPRRRRSLVSNKENLQPNGATAQPKERATFTGKTTHAVTFKNNQRTDHQRGDSLNLLKRLARASSLSPSPAGNKIDHDVLDERPKTEPAAQSPLQLKGRASEERQRSQIKQETRDNIALMNLPDAGATPAQKERPMHAETPVVTGAWVETPLTGRRTNVSDFAQNNIQNREQKQTKVQIDEDLKHAHAHSTIAKSALADIVAQAKNMTNAPFGDATIESLENIMDPEKESANSTLTGNLGEETQQIADYVKASPLTQAQRDQRQEELAMEAMNKHLTAARSSIKNANRGLRRVENRMEHSQIGMDSMIVPPEDDEKHVTLVPARRASQGHCIRCGNCHGSVWGALWTEFRSCFYRWDDSSPYRIRFTRLGFLCFLMLTWYISENILCYNFCKPKYAYSLENIRLSPDMPVYPFVIPTLIFRPFKWLWEPTWDSVTLSIEVWFNSMMGEKSMYPDLWDNQPIAAVTRKNAFAQTWDAATATATVATATYSNRIVNSVVDAVDEVGSMWDDDFL